MRRQSKHLYPVSFACQRPRRKFPFGSGHDLPWNGALCVAHNRDCPEVLPGNRYIDNLEPNLFAGAHSLCQFLPMTNQTSLGELLATRQLADLGPGPREGVESQAGINLRVKQLCASLRGASDRQELIRALALLWHDHLEAAHSIAQGIDNSDGAFVHGIMHRREPDYSNAAYWFRRVGRHAAFPELANQVADLLKTPSDVALKDQLIQGGQWNPFGFIDACQAVATGGSAVEQERLREIQRCEFALLLKWFCRDGTCNDPMKG